MVHRVLVPTDFSESSVRAPCFARDHFPNAQVLVLYAVDFGLHDGGISRGVFELRSDGERAPAAGNEALNRADAESRDRLEPFVRAHTRFDGVTTVFQHGDPVTMILETARERQADLVRMGTHAYRGLEHLLIGSSAKAVVQDAEVPVLIDRPARVLGPTA